MPRLDTSLGVVLGHGLEGFLYIPLEGTFEETRTMPHDKDILKIFLITSCI